MRAATSTRIAAAAAALAAALAGCALKAPPPVADLQKEALPHTAVPASFKSRVGSLFHSGKMRKSWAPSTEWRICSSTSACGRSK